MRFVQLSDPHIMIPEKQPMRGMDTIGHLRRAIASVNALNPAPAFALLTGDLTNDEQPASYELLKTILADLRVPCHLALGNHDARIPFRQIVLGEENPASTGYYYTFVVSDHRFIVLDSLEEGKVTGRLDPTALDWLDAVLTDDTDAPAIIAMHHPPVSIGVDWLDALMLENPEPFFDIVDRRPNIRLILCGHVHQPSRTDRGTVSIMTTPAISIQFRPEPLPPPPSNYFSPDPPSYRIVDIEDGVWKTELRAVT